MAGEAGAAGAGGATRTRTFGAAPGAAGGRIGPGVRIRMPSGIVIRTRAGTVHVTVVFFFIRMISNFATSPLS